MSAPVWDGRGRDPWLPHRLDAALEVAETEEDIRRAVWAALQGWLVQVSRRVLAGGRPDPDAVFALEPTWRQIVASIVRGRILKAVGKAFVKLFGTGYRYDQRPFVTAYLAEVTNRLVRVSDEVYHLVAAEIAVGVNLGEGIPELAKRVDVVLSTTGSERWPNRATVIARTESIGALNAGRSDAFRAYAAESDEELFQLWLATDDARTRETHRLADGQRVPLGEPFQVGGFALRFPGDPAGPPQEVIQCVIGSTEVAWPGQGVLGSTRRRHFGPLVQLITAEGHDLTVTPNHPVLTPTGYVPAGLISPGQRVMCSPFPVDPEVDHAPPSAEQVHRALCKAGKPEGVMGSRMDFHGDGAETEVEIVSADRDLGRQVQTEVPGEVIDLGLIRPTDRKVPLSGLGGAVVLWEPAPGTAGLYLAGRLVSRRGESPAFSGGHARHPDAVGLASAAGLQAQLDQAADDGVTSDADFPAHLQHALAAGMTPCEVVQVNRSTGRHWVYNLSTSDRWFTGNGIALHNCRCTSLLVDADEVLDLSNRQMRGRR